MNALLSSVLLAPSSQAAPDLAVAAAERGLTVPQLALSLGAEPGVRISAGAASPTVSLPLRLGLLDDLELFAAPVLQTVDPVLHEPYAGLTLCFVDGPVEIGVRFAADLGLVGPAKYATLHPGVPLRFHPTGALALDTGAFALVGIAPATTLGVLLPVAGTVSVTDPLFVTVSSGLRITDLSAVGDTVGAPLGAAIGYAVGRNEQAFVDLGARISWDEVRAFDTFAVVASARLHFLKDR